MLKSKRRKRQGQRYTSKKTLKSKSRSYSPSLNNQLGTPNSKTPLPDLQMKYRVIAMGNKMYNWKSLELRKLLLKNVLSNKKIKPTDIIGPKQMDANCWFNTFVTSYFISDKGRKFSKPLRKLMITGKKMDGSNIDTDLRWPMFLLNLYIELFLTGKANSFSTQTNNLNTNQIIKSIYNQIGLLEDIEDVGDAGNPVMFYKALIGYLNREGEQVSSENSLFLRIWDFDIDAIDEIKDLGKSGYDIGAQHMIIIQSDEKNKKKTPLQFSIGKKVYKLDSVILRDTRGAHFSSYLHLNKKSYYFDGENEPTIVPFNWKGYLNTNKYWKTSKLNTKFNFQKGYGLYIYYRTK
jgi:hypothetical protein